MSKASAFLLKEDHREGTPRSKFRLGSDSPLRLDPAAYPVPVARSQAISRYWVQTGLSGINVGSTNGIAIASSNPQIMFVASPVVGVGVHKSADGGFLRGSP